MLTCWSSSEAVSSVWREQRRSWTSTTPAGHHSAPGSLTGMLTLLCSRECSRLDSSFLLDMTDMDDRWYCSGLESLIHQQWTWRTSSRQTSPSLSSSRRTMTRLRSREWCWSMICQAPLPGTLFSSVLWSWRKLWPCSRKLFHQDLKWVKAISNFKLLILNDFNALKGDQFVESSWCNARSHFYHDWIHERENEGTTQVPQEGLFFMHRNWIEIHISYRKVTTRS